MFASIFAALFAPVARPVAVDNTNEMVRCSSASCSLCTGMKKEGDFEFSHFIFKF